MHADPVLKCFDNSAGLNCEDLLVGIVLELASSLTLGTVVPRKDLSGAWETICG
jgi:hypothetical protein